MVLMVNSRGEHSHGFSWSVNDGVNGLLMVG